MGRGSPCHLSARAPIHARVCPCHPCCPMTLHICLCLPWNATAGCVADIGLARRSDLTWFILGVAFGFLTSPWSRRASFGLLYYVLGASAYPSQACSKPLAKT
eukprot:8904301-Pyramimonas_sp.AAC.1